VNTATAVSSCPLLALSGHSKMHAACPLSGAKRTLGKEAAMSANNPHRKLRVRCSTRRVAQRHLDRRYLVTNRP
jgi:hypothetical protein